MEIYSEIGIHAPPHRVWSILTDLENYRAWNPFIRDASGELREGSRIRVTIEPPGGRVVSFQPEVLRVDPERELRWLGHLLFPGLLDGEHVFEIRPDGDSAVRFVQRERFIGIIEPIVRWTEKRILLGFEEMNDALKERAEAPPEQ